MKSETFLGEVVQYMNDNSVKVPTFDQLMNPLITALHLLGGSGTNKEIYEKVILIMNLSDKIEARRMTLDVWFD